MTVVHFDFDKQCKSNSDLRTAYVEMNTYKHKSHIIVQQENIDNLISIHDQKLENSQPACNIIFVGRFSQSINLTYKKQIYKQIRMNHGVYMYYHCLLMYVHRFCKSFQTPEPSTILKHQLNAMFSKRSSFWLNEDQQMNYMF